MLARRVAAGHWEGRLSSSALATATAVTAIAAAERAGLPVEGGHRVVGDGIAWLIRTRNADGGWGDTPDSVSNISTTALVWAALSFGVPSDEVRRAEQSAARWIAGAAGGSDPAHLSAALAARYGKDRTFSVPILTMCAIGGRLGASESAWSLIPPLPFELAALPRRFFGVLRLPVVSYALPALISMGLARHRRGRAIPVVSRLRESAAARVLRVLETLQPRNGGFLEAIPLTSFVAMSLVAAGERDHPAVAKGISFLLRSVRQDGSWPIDTNLATWVTTLALNAVSQDQVSAMLPLIERQRIREWLLEQQWTVEHPYTGAAPGGWAWTDLPGGVPDADDTAGAVLALARLDAADPRVRRAAAAGVTWLLDLQNADGGIPTFCRGWGTLPFDRSSTDLTAHALRAWSAWADAVDHRLTTRIEAATRKAVEFLERSQRHDGAFVPLWFGNQLATAEENPVFGTSRVLKGLMALREGNASRAQPVASAACTFLLAAQNEDGGWGGDKGVRSSVEETAVALSGLAAAPVLTEEVRMALQRGGSWLREETDGFHSFKPSPIGLYFAKLWYAEELYPFILVADAMASLERHASQSGGCESAWAPR